MKFERNQRTAVWLLFCCYCFFSVLGFSQNAIPNASFEQFETCLTESQQKEIPVIRWKMLNLADWNYVIPQQIPEHIATCHANSRGQAHSGKAAIALTVQNQFQSQFLTTKLKFPLQKGKKYFVSVWLMQSEESQADSADLGIYFSPNPVSIQNERPPFVPQLKLLPRKTPEKGKWKQYTWIYQASGDETSLVLGNFNPNGNALVKWFLDDFFVGEKFEEQSNVSNYYVLKILTISKQTQKPIIAQATLGGILIGKDSILTKKMIAGTYPLVVSALGYLPHKETIHLTPESIRLHPGFIKDTLHLTVSLEPITNHKKTNLKIWVREAFTHKTMMGVIAFNHRPVAMEHFFSSPMDSGSLHITVAAEGYFPHEERIVIKGDSLVCNAELRPAGKHHSFLLYPCKATPLSKLTPPQTIRLQERIRMFSSWFKTQKPARWQFVIRTANGVSSENHEADKEFLLKQLSDNGIDASRISFAALPCDADYEPHTIDGIPPSGCCGYEIRKRPESAGNTLSIRIEEQSGATVYGFIESVSTQRTWKLKGKGLEWNEYVGPDSLDCFLFANQKKPVHLKVPIGKVAQDSVIIVKVKMESWTNGQAWNLQRILFSPNSAEFQMEASDELRLLKKYLDAHPAAKIKIIGHTDAGAAGSSPFFLKQLSEKRASAVLNYLIGSGIQSARLTASGKGNSQPIADNETEDGRMMNRRVEIQVVQ